MFCASVVYGVGQNPHDTCNCSNGYYCSNTETGTCSICPVGYYCTNNTQYACDGNTIAQETGMSLCESCSAGTYANETHIICTPCDTGAYIHDTNGVCKPCASGKYANPNHTFCKLCNSGANIVDNGVCMPCPDGQYSNEDHTECTTCENGIVNDGVCYQNGCLPNQYLNESNECEDCLAGFYVSGNICSSCQSGYYCPGNGAQIPCPKGSYSGAGAESCTRCPIGYTTSGTTVSAPMTEADEYPCFLAAVKLGTGPNAIELPSCLTYGKINTKVIKNN